MLGHTPRNHRRFFSVALALALTVPTAHLLLAAGGDDVIDTVDVEVAGRDKVLGTIRPAEERETFLLELPRGAKLKATAKGTGPLAPQPAVEIRDPDGVLLGASPAKASKTPQVAIADSGVHHVRVCGDGLLDGDYKLTVKAKLPKKASETSSVDLGAGAEGTFTFGAAAGTTATITVSASRRSSFVPTILDITGPDEFAFAVAAPERPGKRHVVRNVALPSCGDYTVRFRNDGAASGAWSAKASLRSAKPRRSTIEITDDVLAGEFAGEQAVYARVVDETGGVVAPDGDDVDILGVAIDVPAGAVSEPTLFTISEADPFFVDDDLFEGGTTFELGPAGIEFTENVSVTVPFDAQSYDDPSNEVQIAIRDAETGDVEVVTGTVDVDAGTCTFQTPHFSGFQAVSPRPRPLRGGFVEIEVGGQLDPLLGGAVMLAMNGIVGADGPRTGNGVMRSLDRRSLIFAPGSTGGAVFQADRDQSVQLGNVQADADVTLDLGNRVVTFLRGRSPDVMVRSDGNGDQAVVSVLLRRVKGKTTQGALRGAWHGLVLEYSGAAGTTGGLQIVTAGRRFELDVEPGGRATASDSDLWTTRLAYPGGSPVTDRSRKPPKAGTLRPSGAFARLTMDVGVAEGPASVDLHPVARGDVLVGLAGDFVGTPSSPERAMARLVILVRAGSKGDDGDLDGRSRFVALDSGFETGAVAQAAFPTFELLNLDVEHDGAGSLRARGGSAVFRHGLDGQPSVSGRQIDLTGTYRIEKDLIYRESQPVGPGALLRRRGLYIATQFGDGRFAIGFGLPARPSTD